MVDRPGAQPLVVTRGEVRFEDVSFSYGGARKVVDGFSLVIRPGEKIGLVGRSGAGKSTIVNLLLRLYDVEGGRILVDGQDIAGVTQESLRRPHRLRPGRQRLHAAQRAGGAACLAVASRGDAGSAHGRDHRHPRRPHHALRCLLYTSRCV